MITRITDPANVSKASESLIRSALDTAHSFAFSSTFAETFICLFAAAEATALSAQDADCISILFSRF
jgi:hypothetical protein